MFGKKISLIFLLALAALSIIPAQESMPVKDISFFNPNEPAIDGIVAGNQSSTSGLCQMDTVWSNLYIKPFTLICDDGNTSYSCEMRIAKSRLSDSKDYLYLGFHIYGDEDLSDFDRIFLIFDSDTIHDNQNNWANGDFALQIEALPINTLIQNTLVNDEKCNLPIQGETTLTYWDYDAGANRWNQVANAQLPSNLKASIKRKSAYDFSDDPPSWDTDEINIWEIEIKLPLVYLGSDNKTYFNLSLTDGFGMAAYVFVDDGRNQDNPEGYIFRWPSTIPPRDSFLDTNLNDSSVDQPTPDLLGKSTFSDDYFDVSVVSDATFLNYDDSWGVIKDMNNALDVKIYFDGPGDSLVDFTNKGKMKFHMYSMGNNPILIEDIAFDHYNSYFRKLYYWDVDEAPEDIQDIITDQVGRHCYAITLSDFTVDQSVTNNAQYFNNYIFTASGVERNLYIDPKSIPRKSGQEFVDIFFNLSFENLGSVQRKKTDLKTGYDSRDPAPDTNAEWSSNFADAKELGIKQVKEGLYTLRLRYDDGVKKIRYRLNAGKTPYTPKGYTIHSTCGGSLFGNGKKPLAIPVKQGSMVTILTRGKIDLDGAAGSLPETGPNGIVLEKNADAGWLLADEYYQPELNAGALIASFDSNFTNSFLIGAGSTFTIPEKYSYIYLAVNEIREKFRDNTGYFDIDLIETDNTRIYPSSSPIRIENIKLGIPTMYELGRNLVRNRIEIFYNVSKKVKFENREVIVNTRHPIGYYNYMIRKSHYNDSSFKFTLPHLGWTFFDNKLNLDGGLNAGIKFDYRFLDPGAVSFAAEAEGGCTFTQDAALNWDFLIQAFFNLKINLDIIGNVPIQNADYYSIIGIGGVFLLDSDFKMIDQSLGYNAGVGFHYGFTKNIGTAIELRCLLLQDLLNTGFTYNPQITAGLVFRL